MIKKISAGVVLATLMGASTVLAQSTTTTKKPAAKKENPVKLKFYSELYAPSAEINRGGSDSIGSYNYLGISKKFSMYETIQLRAVFESSQSSAKVLDKNQTISNLQGKGKAGKAAASDDLIEKDLKVQNSQKFKFGETVVQYSNKKPSFLMPKAVRVYLPTSESTDATGRYRIRTYYYDDIGSIGKVNFTAYFIPQFYHYTKEWQGQTAFSVFNVIEAGYDINDTFSLSSEIYYYPTFSRTGKKYSPGSELADGTKEAPKREFNESNFSQTGYLYFYAHAKLTENTKISVYTEQSRDLETGDAFHLFDEDNTSYGFILSASL